MVINTEQHMEIDQDGDEEAGFSQGIIDTTASEPAKAATEQTEQQTVPEQSTDSEPAEVDPFAAFPPQVRDLLANIPTLEQRFQAAEARFKAAEGRVSSLQSRLDKLTQQSKAEDTPKDTPTRYQSVEAIRSELPEIAAAFDELMMHQKQPVAETVKPQELPAMEPAPKPQQEESDPQIDALDQIRPAWRDETGTSDFQLWLATQPAQYRNDVINSYKAVDVLAALSKFDQYRSQVKTTQQSNAVRHARLANAVTPQGDGRRPDQRTLSDEDAEEAAFVAAARSR